MLTVSACQADSGDPADPGDSANSGDPADSDDPADSAVPADPVEPTEPVDPAEPIDPSSLGGDYSVSGDNPDGSTYAGTLSITPRDTYLELAWDTADVYEGTGMLLGDRLIASNRGETCSIMHYERGDVGALSGTWIDAGEEPNVGTEEATPTEDTVGFPGSYAVSGMNPDGSTYEGSLDITGENVLALNWEQVGYPYQGLGLVEDDALAVAWGDEGDCGLVVYRIRPDGVLDGRWAVEGSEDFGTETATPA